VSARAGWRLVAWSCAASGVAALALALLSPVAAVERRDRSGASPASRSPGIATHRADSPPALVVARDLFRGSRRPSGVGYDPQRVDASQSSTPKPVLVLVGLVGGNAPSALIEGFPGIEGARVVQLGDVVAGVRVAAIRAREVRLTGMDTVWTLIVREPWR